MIMNRITLSFTDDALENNTKLRNAMEYRILRQNLFLLLIFFFLPMKITISTLIFKKL